jgi:hypothetical protein
LRLGFIISAFMITRRLLTRTAFALACLITFVVFFYAEENWRGRKAWDACKRRLESKGRVLNWAALIPPPVPDSQNLFKAPAMESFVKGASNNFGVRATHTLGDLPPRHGLDRNPLVALEVSVVPLEKLEAPRPKNDGGSVIARLRIDDPELREKGEHALAAALGPSVDGAQGFMLSARVLKKTAAVPVILGSDRAMTVADLEAIFPTNASVRVGPAANHLRVRQVSSHTFEILVGPAPGLTASEYLKATDPLESDFDLLRKALKRPYVRMDGDYEHPFAIPIPYFVRIRTVAQTLSQRAQSHLLLGDPEAAWKELSLVRDFCRLLEARPVTLVSAMINVAVTGLYAQVVAEGMRLHAWREPQLAAIQAQVGKINLLPELTAAWESEGAALCSTIENTPRSDLPKLFSFGSPGKSLWEKVKSPEYLGMRWMPAGWLYRNMAAIADLNDSFLPCIDAERRLVFPGKADEWTESMTTSLKRSCPYTFLASRAIPNFHRALQTLARNQTLASEAFIACTLERHRLARGEYPETVDALVPQFAESLPQELVTGSPFYYRRISSTHYLLYSVGWNLKDDGGKPGKSAADGDWALGPEI